MHMRTKDIGLGPTKGPLRVRSVQWLHIAGQWQALCCNMNYLKEI